MPATSNLCHIATLKRYKNDPNRVTKNVNICERAVALSARQV